MNKIKELYFNKRFLNKNNISFDFEDGWDEEIWYYLKMNKIPNKLIKIAKKIDKECFMESCFRIMVIYNSKEKVYSSGILEYVTEDDGTEELLYFSKEQIKIFENIIKEYKMQN